ncbi:MAG: insulinase family protein [Alistipes indistinctus]
MKFTRDDLLRFIGRTYNTDQMVFSMIGNISEKRFTELCNRYLGETASHPRTFERDRTDRYVPMTGEPCTAVPIRHTASSAIRLGSLREEETHSAVVADQPAGRSVGQFTAEPRGSRTQRTELYD